MSEQQATGMAALRQAEEQALANNQQGTDLQSDGLQIHDKSLLETGTDSNADRGAEEESNGAPAGGAAGEENNGEYKPPVTEELQPEVIAEAPAAPQAPTAEQSEEAVGYDTTPAIVSKDEMVAPNGSIVSAVMLDRIAKHMRYLKGERGFGSNKERWEEQASFIESVGRSTGLRYDDYVTITNELIQQIRDNIKLFTSGDAYRFMHDLCLKYPENNHIKYPRENAQRYQAYMGFLTTIARNYHQRQRLRTSLDPAFAIQDMSTLGKQNVTKFFNQLTAQ